MASWRARATPSNIMRVADSIASPLLKPISVGPTIAANNANNGD